MHVKTQNWQKTFDEKFVFQTGDWRELGGAPDHQEFLGKPEDIKSFITSLLEEKYQEGLRDGIKKNHERIDGWVDIQVQAAKKMHDLLEEKK